MKSKQRLESKFQRDLVNELKKRFADCMVIRLDPRRKQGIPDLLILWNDCWAALELKRSKGARKRPNQDYYVERMNEMSYASFIFPENKEVVLDDLQRSFESKRASRIPGRK